MHRPWKSFFRQYDLDPRSADVNTHVFCLRTRGELATCNADDALSRVRGARALRELYSEVEPDRFEEILVSLASGRTGSAIADGARWLLPRWKAAT